jgi:uncharacterized protein YecE (DUF72 family)
MGTIRIGISGWRYTPWRGSFYPPDLAQRRELEYAAARFASIELNGSFYSLQSPQLYRRWYAETPDDFVFAIKGSRYITHVLRLRDVAQPLANFFASGLFELKEKLGPFLWQFPPRMVYDEARFEAFFRLLPATAAQAEALARKRDARLSGRAKLKARGVPRRLRHAVEVRHPSFACAAFVKQLRRHGIAVVFADTAGRWPYFEDLTADFVYLRLHGDVELYTSGYTAPALKRWAARIGTWSAGRQARDAKTEGPKQSDARKSRDVYCYFDNDVKVRAPYDARSLAILLGTAGERPPLAAFKAPKGGWAKGLGPRASAQTDGPRPRWPGLRKRAAVKQPAAASAAARRKAS